MQVLHRVASWAEVRLYRISCTSRSAKHLHRIKQEILALLAVDDDCILIRWLEGKVQKGNWSLVFQILVLILGLSQVCCMARWDAY